MKVLLFGATGMVGRGVLLECLDDDRVTSVLAVGRSPTGVSHPKLRERLRDDFFHWDDADADEIAGHDACFFCLGVSAAGMGEAEYTRLTNDLTLAVARALADRAPGMVFCYLSGQGADSTESSRAMWARVRGGTENRLLDMPLDTFIFRPGYIQPMRGVRSRTRLYRALYVLIAPLYPLLRRLTPRSVTTTVAVGRAMIQVAVAGYDKRVLETPDINRIAGTTS